MRPLFLLAFAALSIAPAALGLSFSLESRVGDVWTYTLKFGPNQNYYPGPASVTLDGLHGVTGATAPTSTTFPSPSIDAVNLLWIPDIQAGGTRVVWTIDEGGTGNYSVNMYVYGFSVTAPGAATGPVNVSTSGFHYEIVSTDNIDIHNVPVDGPVHPGRLGDVPEPASGMLLLLGVSLLVLRRAFC